MSVNQTIALSRAQHCRLADWLTAERTPAPGDKQVRCMWVSTGEKGAEQGLIEYESYS